MKLICTKRHTEVYSSTQVMEVPVLTDVTAFRMVLVELNLRDFNQLDQLSPNELRLWLINMITLFKPEGN